MPTRHALNLRRHRRAIAARRRARAHRPRFCRECARKGRRVRLNSREKGPVCGPCLRAAAERLAGYP
jgi:hypothetical protein